ncbi:MAG: glycerophosphodiester phosphodiesterase family protein [Ignavibacteriaceae bacterium]
MKVLILISFGLAIIFLVGCSGSKDVIVTAHRGASGLAPENTLSSFKAAIKNNADFSELDAQETADGVIIVLHDKDLKRTSGSDGNIWELNYGELKNYEVGSWFEKKFDGEKVPTLQEVINLVKGKMKLNIELKMNGHEKVLAEKVVKIIEENDFIDQCIVTSFNFDEIKTVRRLNKNIKVGYIFSKMPDDIDIFKADCDLLSVNKKLVDEEFVKKAHENGKEVHVWTVNEPDEMKKLITLGVESLITNYPNKLNEILDSK